MDLPSEVGTKAVSIDPSSDCEELTPTDVVEVLEGAEDEVSFAPSGSGNVPIPGGPMSEEQIRLNAEVESALEVAGALPVTPLEVGEEAELGLAAARARLKRTLRDADRVVEGPGGVASAEWVLGRERKTLRSLAPLPWECGVTGLVLGAPLLQVPSLPPPLESMADLVTDMVAVKPQIASRRDPPVPGVTRKNAPSALLTAEAQEREKALRSVKVMVYEGADHFGINSLEDVTDDDTAFEETLKDSLARKATATIKSRVSAMILYIRWCHAAGYAPFPLSEVVCYAYVRNLRQDRAPATRGMKFKEALGFFQGTLGLKNVGEVITSPRFQGAVFSHADTKRPLVQRDPLSVVEVSVLESAVLRASLSEPEIVFLGYCLFCLHTCARFGDAQRLEGEPIVDGQYVEAKTAHFKTAHVRGAGKRLLPLAGFAAGVSGEDWARKWLEARKLQKLEAGPDTPTMPAQVQLSDKVTWSQSSMTTSEATAWLVQILRKAGTSRKDMSTLGTHSLRCTLLSWCAKAGVSETSRRLLGRHLKPKDRSVVIYSRDALSKPLRELQEVLEAIRVGKFEPDKSRSGYWSRAQEVDPTDAAPVETPLTGPEVSSSSESEQESEPDEGEVSRAEREVIGLGKGPASMGGDTYVIHQKRGTVHLTHLEKDDLLACGKGLSSLFVPFSEHDVEVTAFCKICFGASVSKSAGKA